MNLQVFYTDGPTTPHICEMSPQSDSGTSHQQRPETCQNYLIEKSRWRHFSCDRFVEELCCYSCVQWGCLSIPFLCTVNEKLAVACVVVADDF